MYVFTRMIAPLIFNCSYNLESDIIIYNRQFDSAIGANKLMCHATSNKNNVFACCI
jgi:hypothetical protein